MTTTAKKKQTSKDKKIVLNTYELEMEDTFNEDNMKSVPNVEQRKRWAQKVAKNTLQKAPITIRPYISDIESIKANAADIGIPYQNIIIALIRKYAKGDITLDFTQQNT